MNPSKIRTCSGRYFLFTLFNIVVTVLVFNFITYRYFFVADPSVYASDIDHGKIHDWWSALYTLQGMGLQRLLDCISIHINGRDFVAIITSCCIALFHLSVHFIASFISPIGKIRLMIHAVLAACVFGFSVIPNSCTLDLIGLAMISVSLTASLYIGKYSKKRDYILLAIVILFLAPALSYRKVFIMLAPFMLTYALAPFLKLKNPRTYLVAFFVASCSSLLLLGIPKLIYPHFAGYIESYPAEPMLRSDIYTAGLIRNDYSTIHYLNSVLPTNRTTYAVGNNTSLGRLQNSEQWSILQKAWVNEWIQYPASMAGARLLQIIQFISGSIAPDWVMDYYCSLYPQFPRVGEKKNNFEWYMYIHRQQWGVAGLIQYVNWIISAMVLSALYLVVRELRVNGWRSSRNNPTVYFGILATMSMLSYTTIVVPTGDLRYKFPCLFFSLLTFICFISTSQSPHQHSVRCR
ncbi:MAG: hypothetical protein ACI4P8_07210 [Akkermansia sp.]